jgi:hypothetical protein
MGGMKARAATKRKQQELPTAPEPQPVGNADLLRQFRALVEEIFPGEDTDINLEIQPQTMSDRGGWYALTIRFKDREKVDPERWEPEPLKIGWQRRDDGTYNNFTEAGAFGLNENLQELKALWHGVIRIVDDANKSSVYTPGIGTDIARLIGDAFNEAIAEFDKANAEVYTSAAPPSSPADTSTEGMRDDFNTDLAVSRYELLARRVDLLNPRLPKAVKLTRAERLLKAYKRLRKIDPDFDDRRPELVTARSIVNSANYQRRKSKLAM